MDEIDEVRNVTCPDCGTVLFRAGIFVASCHNRDGRLLCFRCALELDDQSDQVAADRTYQIVESLRPEFEAICKKRVQEGESDNA